MTLPHVLASALLVATLAGQRTTGTVLFVCEHGAAKSVVAAAYFNKVASERGLPFRAISRGTAPDPAIPATIATGLKNEGLSLPAGFAPTRVSSTDVAGAARVVTFDVVLPDRATQPTRWDGVPAFSDGYTTASAAIRAKVDALLQELEAAAKKK